MVDLERGGMASKLNAARIATTAGENVIIASGRKPNALRKILEGELVGTLILAQGKAISSRKRWIGFSAQPCGRITLDRGVRMESCPAQAVLPLVGLAADKITRDR